MHTAWLDCVGAMLSSGQGLRRFDIWYLLFFYIHFAICELAEMNESEMAATAADVEKLSKGCCAKKTE
jgi:hypothetical protein